MRRKTVVRRRRSGNGGGRKVSLAILAGLVPAVSWSAESASQGNFVGAVERLSLSFFGIRPYPFGFSTGYLSKGLFPLTLGVIAHAAAKRFGINRMIGTLRLPVEI